MPALHAGAVELISREREISTYRATRDTPVEIELHGPTTLALSTRLEFTPSLRGDQRYLVDVRRNGAALLAVTFRTRRSDITTYRRPSRSRTGRVPSVADRVLIPVPAGLHRFVIRPRGTSAPGILVAPSIPLRDVRQGEAAPGAPRITTAARR